MELSDSSRSHIVIDLNEIPTTSSTEIRTDSSLVKPLPAPDMVLREGRDGICGACGRPEMVGHVVVCDGCERGFHLECTGMQGMQAVHLIEWVCGECVESGGRSKGWPLGKKKRNLDINASPPSDADGCGTEVLNLRKHTPGDNSFGGNAFVAPVTYSNILSAGNGFGSKKASETVAHTAVTGFGDILLHTQSKDSRVEDVDMGFTLGRLRSSYNTAIRFPSQNVSEILLQALRKFICERNGVLEEGWHVELRHSTSIRELYAVYCAPDGKTFDSMSEVACYLGLTSNCSLMDTEISAEGCPQQEKLHLPKRRKLTGFSVANGFTENHRSLISGYGNELLSNGFASRSNAIIDTTEAGTEKNVCTGFQQNNDGLPVQFEDFFVLSLGHVDVRPSYCNVNLICPVGYTSCWHDKITGSLFICEVLDGGDSGPIFKIRRCPCSALPIPDGSTILFRPNLGQFSDQHEENNDITYYGKDYDNDVSIQIILSDPCPLMENDLLTCLGSSSNATYDVYPFDNLVLEACSIYDKSGYLLSYSSGLGDEIGEISVEDRSSSSAWRMVAQMFVDACSEICKRKGVLKFSCKHIENRRPSTDWDMEDEKNKVRFASLEKFCGSPVSLGIPSEFHGDNELGRLGDVLKWLDQDRFGLDTEFVQEIIEKLPGVEDCSRYEFLKDRSYYSASLTVANGLLVSKMKGGVESKETEVSGGSFGRSKKPRLAEDRDRSPPPGKPLCLRFPPQIVGDFYQVWELLCRFHEILGLKKPFSLEDLEEELINPWIDDTDPLEKIIQRTEPLSLQRSDVMGEMFSSMNESHLAVSGENLHAFIQIETGAMKEAAQARLHSATYSRCSGAALTKAHSSLLGVLIVELQSKVAALVDPNFDCGESKSKRGRKKDMDSSIPSKRGKLNVLPINELTWPELARRYILAVISMEGILDSTDITAREDGKVFRCLQGDGGMLCGSLSGVAGMEADALLLAEATKKIFGSLNRGNNMLTIEDEGYDVSGSCEKNIVSDGMIPEWAQILEPVRKLPTNVGARIRKCVYDALEKSPPDWARKRLEHSISKEIYKGNASGPTKKAVLLVLTDVQRGVLHPKPDKGSKRKTVICISDIVMMQCRIVLRHAAAADVAKVFCNLLGRRLTGSTGNDDEGLLGSPATVSRPLDFRTIDLRLAVGAYDGSHEAFLEDVRELWNNVRTAYADQSEFVELARTLSDNFESLYEKEVVSLVQKLAGFAKLDFLSAETKKEINDILALTNEIPKAPWDEGVCKVCGVDRDDDSVLLCDTCDAEYHTYCLDPPLARIPEGNWYCPSCVVGNRVVQDASEHSQVIGQHRGKKYQGEVHRAYLEALRHLTTAMEGKEYWEFRVDERIFLLKFLCDELLNSALLRQHLEQCAETTAELQQKLRSLSVQWKNLKYREEIVAARAAKVETGTLNAVGVKEGIATALANNIKCAGQPQKSNIRNNCSTVFCDDLPPTGGCQEESRLNGCDKHPSVLGTEGQMKNPHAIVHKDKIPTQKNENSFRLDELQEIDDSSRASQDKLQNLAKDIDIPLPPLDQQELCVSSEMTGLHVAQDMSSISMNESQAYNLELDNIKNDMLHLQDSITSLESQLLKLSVRREFLGNDFIGRLYWGSATPGMHSWVIVDESLAVHQRRKNPDSRDSAVKRSVLQNSTSSAIDTCFDSEGSKAGCPFLYDPNVAMAICSQWVVYQTDAEIEELIRWLKDDDPKERELKESILHWKKLRSQDSQQSKRQIREDYQSALSTPTTSEKAAAFDCLATKAAILLEKKYGPFLESETTEILKKRGKKARVSNEEKLHRCECLEPIWPSRNHCLSCHRTFSCDVEFEEHNHDRCNTAPPAYEKSKEIIDSSKGKRNMNFDIPREACTIVKDFENSKNECSAMTSRLIKFQNEGLVFPYDLEKISSKFMTKDSNKELVQEIGLIGSNGIPSFVPSLSPFLDESTLKLISQEKVGVPSDEFQAAESLLSSQGKQRGINAGDDSMADNSSRETAANGIQEVLKSNKQAVECPQRDKKSLEGCLSEVGVGHCCVVPQSSLRPLTRKESQITTRLKINLLDMDAALPVEAFKPSKAHLERRWAWRAFVKSSETIYEMVQATIILEDMIRTEYLRNEWWYWSSLSAAAKTSTISSLALRIYSLDAAIIYEKSLSNLDTIGKLKLYRVPEQKPVTSLEPAEKVKASRKSNKKRKEPEG